MSGTQDASRIRSVLAGLVAAAFAAGAVGVGMYATSSGGRFAAAATVVAIGLLAAVVAHCEMVGRARERTRIETALDVELERLGDGVLVNRPGAVAPRDARSRIDAVAAEVRQLREIAEGVHGVEALFDVAGGLVWISPSVHRLTGWTPAECLAAPDAIALLVHESDRKYCQRMAHKVADGHAGTDFEMRLMRKDGQVRWVACHWRPTGADPAHPAGLQMSAKDIQARKETEYKLLETVTELRRTQALRERYLARSNDERQRLSALLNTIRLGILFMDRDHRVLYYNRAMLGIWSFAADENLIGVRDVVLQSRIAGLLEQPEAYVEHVAEVLKLRVVSEPYEFRMRDGRIVTDVSTVVESVQGRRWIGRVWIYEDVTEARRIAQRMIELAERDPLTNLFNRRRFHEELDRFLADATRRDVQVGLIAIDLDGFKPINDAFGHQAGDEVLVRLAHVVGGVIRRNEMFFRFGGDEFGVLVPEADETDLCELARRILEVINMQRFRFDGSDVGVSASLGIAMFPRHACSSGQLVAAADEAMYRSKNNGRNRWTLAGSAGGESDTMTASKSDQPTGTGE